MVRIGVTECCHPMSNHPLCAGPSRVRRTDRFDDIFEHSGGAQQTTQTGGQPRPWAPSSLAARIKFGEVFIVAEHVPHRRTNLRLFWWCEPVAMVHTDVDSWVIHGTRARDR